MHRQSRKRQRNRLKRWLEPSILDDLDPRASSMSSFGFERQVLLAALSSAAWYNIGLIVVLVALVVACVMA